MKDKISILLLTLLLLGVCFLSSEEYIIDYGQWIYLIQLIAIIIVFLRKNNNYIFFFSPSFLTLAYLSINFWLGHWVVSRGIGFDLKYYTKFISFESVRFITGFFVICNWIVFASIPFKRFSKIANVEKRTFTKNVSNVKIFFLFFLMLIFGYINIDLSLIGGSGDFSYVFKLAIAIILVFIVNAKENKIKYIYYFIIIFLFLVGSYESKREILYVIILMLFFELIRSKINIKIRVKQIILFIIGFALLFYIVIISSILRGYGNYNVDNPIDASEYVIDYLNTDYVASALSANFELTSVYGNSSNAINYVYTNQVELLYGSTFIKFVFIPIPRSIFPDKPESMINIYTNKFSPSFRAIGGSYPVIIYAESFWNFSLLGLPLIFVIFFLLNKMYLKVVKNTLLSVLTSGSVFYIYLYITFIQFVRGSGFEIWLLYGILSIPFVLIILNIFKLKTLEK